jgi:hypothetical protein
MSFFKKFNFKSTKKVLFYTYFTLFITLAVSYRWVPMIKHAIKYQPKEADLTASSFPSKSPEINHPELNYLLTSSLDNTKKFIKESVDSQQCGVNIQGSQNYVARNSTGATFICQSGTNINIYIIFPWQLDKHGRKIQLTAKIISDDRQWVLGSSDRVEGTNQGLSVLIGSEFNKETEKLLLSDFSTQVMVGTASQEGNNRSEKELAQRRAVTMREFHNKTFGKRPEYLLNLGRFQKNRCDKYYPNTTKYQRPIIMMNVIREPNSPDPNRNELREIIKEKLESLGYGLSSTCYSDFDLSV